MLYADDADIASNLTEDLSKMTGIVTAFEKQICCARNEKGDNAAPQCHQRSCGPDARFLSVGPEIYLQTMHSLYLGAVLSSHAPSLCRKLNDGSDMLRSFQA